MVSGACSRTRTVVPLLPVPGMGCAPSAVDADFVLRVSTSPAPQRPAWLAAGVEEAAALAGSAKPAVPPMRKAQSLMSVHSTGGNKGAGPVLKDGSVGAAAIGASKRNLTAKVAPAAAVAAAAVSPTSMRSSTDKRRSASDADAGGADGSGGGLGMRIGEWQLGTLIGRGTLGRCFLARHGRTGQHVLVKRVSRAQIFVRQNRESVMSEVKILRMLTGNEFFVQL